MKNVASGTIELANGLGNRDFIVFFYHFNAERVASEVFGAVHSVDDLFCLLFDFFNGLFVETRKYCVDGQF